MQPLTLSHAERDAFLHAARCLGHQDEDLPLARLADGLWPQGAPAPSTVPGEAELVRLGVLELAGLLTNLPITARWVQLCRLPGPVRREVRGARDSCPPDRLELESLQDFLAHPQLVSLQPALRAGLHRLSRILVDQEESEVGLRTSGLPPVWCRCVLAARMRLARHPTTRARAEEIRSASAVKE